MLFSPLSPWLASFLLSSTSFCSRGDLSFKVAAEKLHFYSFKGHIRERNNQLTMFAAWTGRHKHGEANKSLHVHVVALRVSKTYWIFKSFLATLNKPKWHFSQGHVTWEPTLLSFVICVASFYRCILEFSTVLRRPKWQFLRPISNANLCSYSIIRVNLN